LADQEDSKKLQGPALEFYQKMLGLKVNRIEGNQGKMTLDELVRFTFTCIDERYSGKEFSFDLLVRVDNYASIWVF
jgi:Chromosome segregation protein Spc25